MAAPKIVRKKRPPKLPSGTTARAVAEWVGAHPDSEPTETVKLRILARQAGKCALTGRKFLKGDAKRLDHIKPLRDGGENCESNLQWILSDKHKEKTADEAAERKKVRAKQVADAGLKTESKRPLQSRNDLAKSDKEPKITRAPMDHMPSNLARRYGIK